MRCKIALLHDYYCHFFESQQAAKQEEMGNTVSLSSPSGSDDQIGLGLREGSQ